MKTRKEARSQTHEKPVLAQATSLNTLAENDVKQVFPKKRCSLKQAAFRALALQRELEANSRAAAKTRAKNAGGILWVSPATTPRQDTAPLQLRAYHMIDLEGHQKPILQIAQNLNFVVSVSQDEVFIWWKQKWRIVHRLECPQVYQLTMTDKLLITRDAESRICLWNPAQGKFILSHRLPDARAPIGVSEKNFLVAAHTTDVLEVFKVSETSIQWRCMMENSAHKGPVDALSCGGGYCVTGIRGRGLFLWLIDIDYERFAHCVACFDAPSKALLPCSVSMSERRPGLFMASFFDGAVIVSPEHHELKEIRRKSDIFEIGTPTSFVIRHDEDVSNPGASCVSVSKEGRLAVIAIDGMGIMTYDILNHCQLHIMKHSERVRSAVVCYNRKDSTNGYEIVSGHRNNKLSVWSLEPVIQVRLAFLMGLHTIAGDASVLRRVLAGEPTMYAALKKSKAIGRILSMAAAWLPQREVQHVFADADNEGNLFDNASFALKSYSPHDVLKRDKRASDIGRPSRKMPPGVHSLSDTVTGEIVVLKLEDSDADE